MGELSSGMAALEAAEVAPGSEATLQQLQNPSRRPPRPREPIPEHLLKRDQFELDEKFLQKLRSAQRRGRRTFWHDFRTSEDFVGERA